MKQLFLIIVLVSFTGLKARSQEQERVLTDTEKILGLTRLWEGVRSNYVYYDQLQFDWDSLYAASIPKVLEIKDTYTYLRELERLGASVGDGHTYVAHQVQPIWENRIKPAPFTTTFVEGKVLVDKVWSSLLEKRGIAKGTEVVSINGMDVMDYAKKVLGQYISSSTPQWTYYHAFKNYQLTKGARTEHITIGFKNDKKEFSMDIDRDASWDLQDSQSQKQENVQEEDNATMNYTVMEDNIGLLTIRSFMDNSFNALFDELYLKLMSSDALIIDLRNNGGGNSGYADYILRHLSEKPIKTSSWSSRMYIPAHASWGYPQEWYGEASDFLKPVKKEIYKNPIAVLVNANTFSSAEDFCVKFKGMGRGKIIGEPTGGSTGNGVKIVLIEGLATANICAKKDIAPDGSVFVGIGVIPDIKIVQTKAVWLSGNDIVLEEGIRAVKF